MIKIDVPKNVNLIINILEKNGFEAYAVGGCVRDAILSREPNDWDITTSALPKEVKGIFNKTIDTGIKHGTITVMIEKKGYEVTTYRIDGEYEDGRHPKSVEFTSNLVEDLKRRDFTINAMAYSDRGGLVDAFDGIRDLERKLIKCVGNPEDRFNEDALRILRAVRFSAALGFDIEEETKKAIIKLAGNLEKISKERIQAELEKLIMSNHPEKFKIAYETGITKIILPEIDRLAEENKLEEIIEIVSNMKQEHYLRWAGLLIETDREISSKILRGLKFDNKTINIVSRLVEASKRELPETRAGVRRDIYELGEDIYPKYLEFMTEYFSIMDKNNNEADEINKTKDGTNDRIEKLEYIKKEYEDILEAKECISLKGLAANGRDLIELGVTRGDEVGKGLSMLLDRVLDDQSLNTKEKLINIFKDTYS